MALRWKLQRRAPQPGARSTGTCLPFPETAPRPGAADFSGVVDSIHGFRVESTFGAEPSTQAGLAKQRLPVRGPDRYPQPGNRSPRIIEPLLSFMITKGASPDFSVRHGKAPSSNGCETRPTTVAPVGSSQGGRWKRRSLRDLGKFSEFSTFPLPRRRRLFSGSRPPLRRPPRLWPGSTAGHSRVKRSATVSARKRFPPAV